MSRKLWIISLLIFLGKGKGIASINKHNVVIRYADMWSLLFAILVMNVGIQTAQVYGQYQYLKDHNNSLQQLE